MKKCFTILLIILLSLACSHLKKSEDQKRDISEDNNQDPILENSNQVLIKLQSKKLQLFKNNLNELAKEISEGNKKDIEFLTKELFLKANRASLKGNYSTSLLLYEFILMLNPDNIFLRKKYAIEQIKVGQINESIKNLELLFQHHKGKDLQTGLLLGWAYLTNSEIIKARSIYQNIIENNNDHQDACISLSKTYAIEEKFEKAHTILSECEKKSKANGIYQFQKGNYYQFQNKLSKAEKHFINALKISPENLEYIIALGNFYSTRNMKLKALEEYKKFIELSPNNLMVLEKIIQILLEQKKYKESITYLKKYTRIDPEDLNAKLKLGILFLDSNKLLNAKGIFKQIIKKVPDSDNAHYYLATTYLKLNDSEKAIESFKNISKESNLYFDSNLNIANILLKQAIEVNKDQKTKEQKFLNFIAERSKTVPEIKLKLHILMASYYEYFDNFKTAIKIIKENKSDSKYSTEHDYYLATLYEKNKNYQKSYETLEKIIKKDPLNAHAWNFIGYSLIERNLEFDKAYKYIKKAISLKPDDGYIRDSLAWYYFKIGNYKKALNEIKIALTNAKDDVEVLKHLAEIYLALGENNLAKKNIIFAYQNCHEKEEKNNVIKIMKKIIPIHIFKYTYIKRNNIVVDPLAFQGYQIPLN